MGKQSDTFLEGEAEQWFARNQNKLRVDDDPIIEAIESARIKPRSILEVGCSNGWRVRLMKVKWGCYSVGIDPLFKTSLWDCRQGTADDLSAFDDNQFDLLIYGWCLYLCDREDLFKIVLEGDRVLRDGGHLVIYDFLPAKPYKRKYKHSPGLFSYKMDYSHLWLANPAYHLVHRAMYDSGEDRTCVSILCKSIEDGWPLHD